MNRRNKESEPRAYLVQHRAREKSENAAHKVSECSRASRASVLPPVFSAALVPRPEGDPPVAAPLPARVQSGHLRAPITPEDGR